MRQATRSPLSAEPNGGTVPEEKVSAARPVVMPYSSYEDARAREAELLQSAQRVKIGSAPRGEHRPVFTLGGLMRLLGARRARKPAVTRA